MCGHLVMARFLSGSVPREYRVDEGPSWCEPLIAHFKKYEERSGAVGVSELEQRSLNALVGGHMLRMKPEERESATGCLEQGYFRWLPRTHLKYSRSSSLSRTTIGQS